MRQPPHRPDGWLLRHPRCTGHHGENMVFCYGGGWVCAGRGARKGEKGHCGLKTWSKCTVLISEGHCISITPVFVTGQ